jgi:hypothetical protein
MYKFAFTNNLLASDSPVNEETYFIIPKTKVNIIYIRKFQIILQEKLQLEIWLLMLYRDTIYVFCEKYT